MRSKLIVTTAAVTLVALVSGAYAAIIVEDTWTSGSEGWFTSAFLGTPGTALGDDASPQYLEITGGDPGNQPAESEIYTQDGPFIGNWTAGAQPTRSMSFDFYAPTTAPARLELYFASDTGFTWYYEVTVAAGGWNSFTVNMLADDDPGGWYAIGRTAADFATDMAGVNEVGILLAYTLDGAGQVYGLDNFELNDQFVVPEPSTYAALGVALLSLGITFRKRVRETMSKDAQKS